MVVDRKSEGHLLVDASKKIQSYIAKNNLYLDHFIADPVQWERIACTTHTLKNTALAINDFLANGSGERTGERHLRFIGFMQSIFMHQDAISLLNDALFDKPLVLPSAEACVEIRNMRHLFAGHPTPDLKRKKPRDTYGYVQNIDADATIVRIEARPGSGLFEAETLADVIRSEQPGTALDAINFHEVGAQYITAAVEQLEVLFERLRVDMAPLFDPEMNPEIIP